MSNNALCMLGPIILTPRGNTVLKARIYKVQVIRNAWLDMQWKDRLVMWLTLLTDYGMAVVNPVHLLVLLQLKLLPTEPLRIALIRHLHSLLTTFVAERMNIGLKLTKQSLNYRL